MKVLIIFSALIVLQFATANVVKRNCEGCVDEGVNYAVNDTWVKSCVTYKCIAENSDIGIIEKRCPEPNNENTCRDLGDSWTYQETSTDYGYCIDYTCTQSSNANVLPYGAGSNLRCRYKGQCFANDEFVDLANCQRLTCNVTGSSVGYAYSDTPDCAGSCTITVDGVSTTYAAGETWTYSCHRYTCVGANDYTVVRECCQINFGGETLTYNIGEFNFPGIPCSTYECDLATGFGLVSGGCQDNQGNCRPDGENWLEGCFNYTCAGSQKSFLNGGCQDSANNVCRDVGETWENIVPNGVGYTDTGICYEYTCSFAANTFSISSQKRCWALGECFDMDTLHAYQPENCKETTCSYNENNQITTSFPTKCKDSDGACHEYGTNGWPLTIGGQQCQNCTCSLTGTTVYYSCYDHA